MASGTAQHIKLRNGDMRARVYVAMLIAFCAITSLVADNNAVAEHDVRDLMSSIVSSFEAGDTQSIEKMVKDKEFRESLLVMIRFNPKPQYLRLELDSILMTAPFIVRVKCYTHQALYPQRPFLVELDLDKSDGRYFVSGSWCRQTEEMSCLYDVAFPACREMADCVNRRDTNTVLRLFGADLGEARGAKFRRFLAKRGAEWIDDAMRKKLRVKCDDRMPALPVDITDAGMGLRAEFGVLASDGTVAEKHALLFNDEHFVEKFVTSGNGPRTTTSFEFENRAALEDGVRKYMSDLTGVVGAGDSAAIGKMVKNEKVLRSWVGEIEKGKAPGFKLEYDSLVSLAPLVARAKMCSGVGQGAREPLLVEMQLERTEDQYEMVKIAARQGDEEMFKAYGASNASTNVVPRATVPFAPEEKVALEDDVRNFVSLFGSAMKARDVAAVKRLVKVEEYTHNIIEEISRIKLKIHGLEFDSILSLHPMIVRVRSFESVKSKKPIPVEMQLERTDDGYAIVKIWSDQVEKQNLAVERASLESRKMVLYVNRCDTNSVVQMFGAKPGNSVNFKFREFLKKRGVEWIDDVMRENRRIEGGWAWVLRDKGEVVGMGTGFNELNPDKSVKSKHELLYRDGHFVGKHTPEPVVVNPK